MFRSGNIPVHLSHKNELYKLEFSDDACISDVRERAAEVTGLDPVSFKLLSRGRELSSATTLASLRSLMIRPVKLMMVEKLQPRSSTEDETPKAKVQTKQPAKTPAKPHGKEAIAARLAQKRASPLRAVDKACNDLPACARKVANLEAAPDWSNTEQKELLGTNEQCERMLLALDELTGLDGEARAHKKSRIDELNTLCSRLDRMKQARAGSVNG